jgi:hypothetical protein
MNTQTAIITSGHFTEAGNFTGKTLTGVKKIFIAKSLMESNGYDIDTPPSLPIYAAIVDMTYHKVDSENNPTEETFVRTDAGAIFKDEDTLIKAINSERLLNVKAEMAFKASATSLGLTEDEIVALSAIEV